MGAAALLAGRLGVPLLRRAMPAALAAVTTDVREATGDDLRRGVLGREVPARKAGQA